ncbi:phenylalanine--tRNA ligase subunit beta [soil metagenome]
MRVPLSWLRDYVDFDLPAERLAERLTILGMEVQSIDEVGQGWSSVVVGELIEVMPHPNADRLSLTKVRVADAGQPLSIVCGATNISVGQRVPVALPGAVLPGDRRIGVTSIQGTESQGMLCSGAELGLTPDSDGILILAQPAATDGLPGLSLGRPLSEVIGDTVLDIDVKPNRGDALSLIGLAREVAAITGGRVRWPVIVVPESGDATADHVSVEIADKHLCPRFVARYADGVAVGPSPIQVQLRLAAAGMRPVSNAVDASNYVMLELGKPIHVFDAAAVTGGVIVVRTAHEGEQLETLDHVQRTLTTDTLLITDSSGPLGIAGVMGGAGSEVGPGTTAVIIESAVFDPVSIRRTAQRYALRSEASLRFEKGQEARLALVGADRTAQLLAEWAGARVAVGAVDTNPVDDDPRRVSFRPARVSRLLGQEIEPAEMVAALERVEIETQPGAAGDGTLTAVVPAHRRDIVIEEDVIEEVARVRGYENLPPRLPDTEMPSYRPDPRRMINTLRDLLAGRGLAEVVTHGLIGPADHARLGHAADDPTTTRVANPVSADHSELRRSLVPGLIGVLARNERQRRTDVAVFEVGAVHSWRDGGPEQHDELGILLGGDWRPQSWAEGARPASVEDLKGIIEALAARLNVGRLAYAPIDARAGVEHPTRSATVSVAATGAAVGRVGELHPGLLEAFEVRSDRAAFAVLDVAALVAHAQPRPRVERLADLPMVERDLAIVIDRDTHAANVEGVIRANAGPYLAALSVFDRYQGAPLEAGQVSLAYRLSYQAVDEPLGEQLIEDSVAVISAALERDVGGRIRSAG